MRSLLVLILAAGLSLQLGCATARKKETPAGKIKEAPATFAIRKVGISPKMFWPGKGETTSIRWNQNRSGTTVLEIRHEAGMTLRRIAKESPEGDQLVNWDGRDERGETVPPGVYLYILRSEDKKGNIALHDPSFTTGGEELTVERFTFDKEKGILEFIMPRAGRARLRVGLSPFMHLRTLLDWEMLEAGSQTIGWDGLDSSGWIRAIHHPDLSVNLAAFSLPDNAILVKGSPKEISNGSFQNPLRKKSPGIYLHAMHDRENCRDVSMGIEFPNSRKNQEGLPILGDKTLIRVSLEEPDKNFMTNQRFEVMFFVDTVLLFEEEDGQDPFNFEWDTAGLAPGEHLLTVNLIGYDDHLGVKTFRVLKE